MSDISRTSRSRQGSTRRQVLRLGGGGALLLPLLDVGVGRAASLAGPSAKRFITHFVPNGVVPQEWWPDGSENDFRLRQILQPLESHKANLLVMKGIANAVAHNTPSQQDGHTSAIPSFLGGVAPTFPIEGSHAPHGQEITIDQVIANHIEQGGVVLKKKSLQLGHSHDGFLGEVICYAGPEKPLIPIGGPADFFKMLFEDPSAVTDG